MNREVAQHAPGCVLIDGEIQRTGRGEREQRHRQAEGDPTRPARLQQLGSQGAAAIASAGTAGST